MVVPLLGLSASPLFGADEEINTQQSEQTASILSESTLSESVVEQTSIVRDMIPDSLKGEQIFGLEYWQWIGLFILILIGVIIDRAVRLAIRIAIIRITTKHNTSADRQSIAKVAQPIGLLASAIFWYYVIEALNLHGTAQTILIAAVSILAVLACAWAAWRLTDLFTDILAKKAERTDTKFDDVLVPLLKKTIKIFILIFAVISGADVLNIPIGPLLASLGIGGLAFAFAAKDTIENFFGSVAVIIDRPFSIGDWVVIDDTEGTVEELGFRSTRVRTFYNSLVTVPNSTLVRATVDNYGRRKYRRWKCYIGVQYDTSPEKLIAFTEGIRELVRKHPYTRKDYFHVYMNQFGASSLDLLLYVFFKTPDWAVELRERERLFIDIVRLADQLGVQFAFPTQTVHLYHEDHTQQHQPANVPSDQTDLSAQILGINAAGKITAGQPWQTTQPGPVIYTEGPTISPTTTSSPTKDDDNNNDNTQIENRKDGS